VAFAFIRTDPASTRNGECMKTAAVPDEDIALGFATGVSTVRVVRATAAAIEMCAVSRFTDALASSN
jgi:hypothetical protein